MRPKSLIGRIASPKVGDFAGRPSSSLVNLSECNNRKKSSKNGEGEEQKSEENMDDDNDDDDAADSPNADDSLFLNDVIASSGEHFLVHY